MKKSLSAGKVLHAPAAVGRNGSRQPLGQSIQMGLLSESFAVDEVRAGRLKMLPIRDFELTRELGIAYRANRALPRAVSSFVASVRQTAASASG